jgi:class 3 adenylate cyclase/tetratricopeptide (TPR) repeat protein
MRMAKQSMVQSGASPALTGEITRLLRQLQAKNGLNLAFLQAVWRTHDPNAWAQSPNIYRRFGQKVLQSGEPLLAYDALTEGLKRFPEDVVLRQLMGLSLARSGASDAANALLATLYREGHDDEETLGLLARTHKDLAAQADSPAERQRHLRKAHRLYSKAYRNWGGYWTGINAATLACVLAEKNRAARLAAEVETQCRRKLRGLNANSAERYWVLSTLGEAALAQQKWDDAEYWYSDAVQAAASDWGSLQSTRNNMRLLLRYLGADPGRYEQLFRFPTVVVFAGHLLDRKERRVPRFPASLVEAVKREIRRRVEGVNARFGYASAACGADILFDEVMLETGGEVHIVLPQERELFIKNSVDLDGRGDWVPRFEKILAKAVEVQELSSGDDRASLEFANLTLLGSAKLRAQQLETRLVPLAVWDGRLGDGPGGTADCVAQWRRLGLEVEIVDLAAMLHRDGANTVRGRSTAQQGRAGRRRRDYAAKIRALLFADFQGFSRLSDHEVPRFVRHGLGVVGKVSLRSRYKPVLKNTWGDGLYLVFTSMRDAGEYALQLRDAIRNIAWVDKGLPEMKVRIALHAGPVFCCTDPVTGRINYIGAHVSRAARIEPITPPGQVYTSQSFAALAAAEGVRGFRCEYVGQTTLAKGYGTFPTYVVLRRSPVWNPAQMSVSGGALAKQASAGLKISPTVVQGVLGRWRRRTCGEPEPFPSSG